MNWFDAAAAGDAATLEKLLGEGQDVNELDPDGRTALDHAEASGNRDAIRELGWRGALPGGDVRAPVAERRGIPGARMEGDSWTRVALGLAGPGVAAFETLLAEAADWKGVGAIDAGVTADLLAGELAPPDGGWGLLLKLAGRRWRSR